MSRESRRASARNKSGVWRTTHAAAIPRKRRGNRSRWFARAPSGGSVRPPRCTCRRCRSQTAPDKLDDRPSFEGSGRPAGAGITRGARGQADAWKSFVQQLINGITLGSIYGLIAIGYTMVFGIIGMVNFAHGDVFMRLGLHRADRLPDPDHLARRQLDRHRAVHRADRRHGVHVAGQLDDRAPRLPAAARLVPPRAADLGDRHVDLPDRISSRSTQGPRNKSIPPIVRRSHRDRWSATATRCADQLQAAHHLVDHRGPAGRLLVPGRRRPRSAARSAPASRTRRWRRCSASTSTAPSRSPSSSAPRSRPSPAPCT